MTEADSGRNKKLELLESWKNGRRALRDAVLDLEWEDMEIKAFGGLSVKDILAHVIEWDKSALKNSQAFLAGEYLDFEPDEDNDTFNERAAETWDGKEAGWVRLEFLSSTDRVYDFLDRSSFVDLTQDKGIKHKDQVVNPAWFLVDPEHDLAHAREILEWREKAGIGERLQTT